MSSPLNRRGLPLAITLVVLALPASAAAQATRTWVSGLGDDANPCSRTAPCKTFAGAFTKTAAGGEIDAIDSGGFGPISINKAVTLVGTGVNASVIASGTTGIIINAGDNDVVTLRDIQINGTAQYAPLPGTIGVNIVHAGAVHLDHDSIFGFTQNGVQFEPTAAIASGAPNPKLYVDNTRIEDAGQDGILVAPVAGVRASAVVTNSTIEDSGCGLVASSLGTAAFTLSGCGAGATSAGTASIASSDTSVSGNGGAGVVSVGSGSTNFLSSDLVSGNALGLSRISGGVITEIGANNSVFGNTTDGAPTSMVSTGAAGPQGANGANGANGVNGASGANGVSGANGINGKNGAVELITCKSATRTVTKTVHHKRKRVKQTYEKCTGKIVSGTVKFTAAAGDLRSASLASGGRTVASGTVQASGGARYKGLFRVTRRVHSGRYTLTVHRGRRTSHRAVVVA